MKKQLTKPKADMLSQLKELPDSEIETPEENWRTCAARQATRITAISR
jgi:hypothetical protein